MIRRYEDNADVLEYLDSFAFSIARILESQEVVNWDDIAGVCNQRAYALRQSEDVALNMAILDECERSVRRILQAAPAE